MQLLPSAFADRSAIPRRPARLELDQYGADQPRQNAQKAQGTFS